jgi:hypothetical protein
MANNNFILVICAKEEDYKMWLRSNGRNPKFSRMLTAEDKLFDLKDFDIVAYGNWVNDRWARNAVKYLEMITHKKIG